MGCKIAAHDTTIVIISHGSIIPKRAIKFAIHRERENFILPAITINEKQIIRKINGKGTIPVGFGIH